MQLGLYIFKCSPNTNKFMYFKTYKYTDFDYMTLKYVSP